MTDLPLGLNIAVFAAAAAAVGWFGVRLSAYALEIRERTGRGPILREGGRFALMATLLGLVLTMVYVVGMLMRRRRTVLRMGADSLLVLLLYVGGTGLLYRER